MASKTTPAARKQSKTLAYLRDLRERNPNAEPASLIASFLLLHELTAIVPLLALFGVFKYAGIGDGLVKYVSETPSGASSDDNEQQREEGAVSAARAKLASWANEGAQSAERLGKRYEWLRTTDTTAGDGASLVAAYVLVKVRLFSVSLLSGIHPLMLPLQAALPLRLLLSARLAVPMASSLVGRLKSVRALGARVMKRL